MQGKNIHVFECVKGMAGYKFSYFRSCFFNILCRTSFWEAYSTMSSRPRVISFILCCHSWYRGICLGAKWWCCWWETLAGFQRKGPIGRLNLNFQPYLEESEQNKEAERVAGLKRRSALRIGNTHLKISCYWPKKSKMNHPESSQQRETRDTCCEATQQGCMSPHGASESITTCVKSAYTLILLTMWRWGWWYKGAIIRAV